MTWRVVTNGTAAFLGRPLTDAGQSRRISIVMHHLKWCRAAEAPAS